MENVYQKLAEHLDRLPGGFTPSRTGAEIRLLEGLFTPEEAKLAVLLTLEQEDSATVAAKANISEDAVKIMLEEMARKGLIFSVRDKEEKMLYQAAPWVIGIYEFQVNRLTDDFLRNIDDYWSSIKDREEPKTISQMRIIPINESIDTRLGILPYENVIALVDAHDKFGVAPCICRNRAKKLGKGCDAPLESCLLFGDFADFYVRVGNGRYITKSEMKGLLVKANEANLVLNPTNSKRVSAICCCCGCCCGILRGLKSAPKPSEAVTSPFIAELDISKCVGCQKCEERCQMQAITVDYGQANLNKDKCIGCGLCVSTCPSKALTLRRKQNMVGGAPETFYDTWRTISKEMSGI